MNAKVTTNRRADDAPSGVRAALQLWTEIERARSERDAADALTARLTGTLELLIESLPVAERAEYQRRLIEIRSAPLRPTRGGEVYENVIELFRDSGSREWTFQEIQNALHQRGKTADPKSIYNLINYFTKTGRLQRIARGRYFVRDFGAGAHGAEDLGNDGTTRFTEHDY
jgi:hypothetical protein